MRYGETVKGRFIERPNRFIAVVEAEGKRQTVHVKNTGRCRELLTPGAEVILEKFPESSARKTKFDLIAVYKGGLLINMDSQSPNKAAGEFIPRLFPDVTLIRPETKFGNSRLDFYIEAKSPDNAHVTRKIFMEVKGCTLENEGICMFPDAPTQRGRKHIGELTECVRSGFEAYILFVIQMSGMKYFTPNYGTDPQFGEALKMAEAAGVRLLAYECRVTEESMEIEKQIGIIL
ncbi:MAG: DNA/RNA nuclease SfsA [Ruminococcus sp.]|nr:DNA/RNA nuclease SfsA [Ruminococcus sp.]